MCAYRLQQQINPIIWRSLNCLPSAPVDSYIINIQPSLPHLLYYLHIRYDGVDSNYLFGEQSVFIRTCIYCVWRVLLGVVNSRSRASITVLRSGFINALLCCFRPVFNRRLIDTERKDTTITLSH